LTLDGCQLQTITSISPSSFFWHYHRPHYRNKPEKVTTETGNHQSRHMDSSLHEVWQAAAGSPFVPTIGKGSQFPVAFVLVVLGFLLGGAFLLSTCSQFSLPDCPY
jgi:hypothetical protein